MKGQILDSGVCMVVLGCRGEDVYNRHLSGFHVCECEDVSLHVDSYEGVDAFEGCEEGFCIVCLGGCVQDQNKNKGVFHHLIMQSRMI